MEAAELTEDLIDDLCNYMRIIDLLKKSPDVIEEIPDLKEQMELFCTKVQEIMELLTPEQCDMVLEEHRLQLMEIEKIQAENAEKE